MADCGDGAGGSLEDGACSSGAGREAVRIVLGNGELLGARDGVVLGGGRNGRTGKEEGQVSNAQQNTNHCPTYSLVSHTAQGCPTGPGPRGDGGGGSLICACAALRTC